MDGSDDTLLLTSKSKLSGNGGQGVKHFRSKGQQTCTFSLVLASGGPVSGMDRNGN